VRIEELKQQYQLDLRWVYFPLHPETPAEGVSLITMFAGRYSAAEIAGMQANLQQRCAQAGLPYDGSRAFTYNSRMAQELAKWADGLPEGPALHGALYRAYFVKGANLADVDVLVDIATEVGLEPKSARHILAERQYQSEVDADWQRSRSMGVTGVPTFLVGQQALVGAQPFEQLVQLIETAKATG